MEKRRKDNIGFFIAIVSMIVVVCIMGASIYSLKAPGKNQMEKSFQQNKTDLVTVSEYFINSGYTEIYIEKSDYHTGTMFTGVYTHDVKIEDESVLKAMGRLFKTYQTMERNGNIIFFEKWRFGEDCRDLAYSINGTNEPHIQYLIESEPLSETGWYYCLVDYDQ